MNNYLASGRHITVVSNRNIRSGEIYVDDALYGVACVDADAGEALTISTKGVFKIPLPGSLKAKTGSPIKAKPDGSLSTTEGVTIGVVIDKASNAVLLK